MNNKLKDRLLGLYCEQNSIPLVWKYAVKGTLGFNVFVLRHECDILINSVKDEILIKIARFFKFVK